MTIHVREFLMRVLALVGALVTVALTTAPLAAQNPEAQAEFKLTRAEIQRDRQAIVRAALKLDSVQSATFWPVYTEYKTEQEKSSDRAFKALSDFATNYDKLDDVNAKPVLDNWLGAREDQAKLARKWRSKFSKAIGEKKTLRFYQIESKLDQAIQGELIQQIPLAK